MTTAYDAGSTLVQELLYPKPCDSICLSSWLAWPLTSVAAVVRYRARTTAAGEPRDSVREVVRVAALGGTRATRVAVERAAPAVPGLWAAPI